MNFSQNMRASNVYQFNGRDKHASVSNLSEIRTCGSSDTELVQSTISLSFSDVNNCKMLLAVAITRNCQLIVRRLSCNILDNTSCVLPNYSTHHKRSTIKHSKCLQRTSVQHIQKIKLIARNMSSKTKQSDDTVSRFCICLCLCFSFQFFVYFVGSSIF